ncbi:sulfite exporter TauE/SafE family protein [Xylophilus sp. GOD-11R]|uniref:sulfite exporter TauE/SafE family protein n=1 Tax=Xylophilus sp. GOD-11R TaxID=3089814 RepID=UPI00298D3384|nr:sulfite exporter TauE/SafE family protein [Xylophilus sp. GOD-11R]WPB56296.1 sulfite exporter TauE/SafE family protein [Xylophilus sp. GOD-11R]
MNVFFLGAVAGLVMGLTGAGGGVLAVPLLVFGLGLGVAQAAPIGLVGIATATGVGTVLGLRAGTVRWRAALLIGVVGVAVSPLGAIAAHALPDAPLTLLFAAVLALSSSRTLYGALRPSTIVARDEDLIPCLLNPASGRLRWTRRCAVFMAAVGGVSGWMSGMFGVGGGFVIVPSLKRYSDVSPREVLSTSLAVIFIVSGSGAALALAHGRAAPAIAVPFSAGCLAMLLVGSAVAGRVNQRWTTIAFAAVGFLVAGMLVLKVVGGLVV